MENQLIQTIKQIFSTLANNSNLSKLNNKINIGKYEQDLLLELTPDQINTPIGNILPLLNEKKSKLNDSIIDFSMLKKLTEVLSKPQSVVRLDHLGLCYKVNSASAEKVRLIKQVKQSNLNIYEEPSIDDGLWLFVGDINQLYDPLIELVLIEKTNDQWQDYWLPHIQIDINTNLTADEISLKISSIYGKNIKPYMIIINGITYIVRCRLGIINGININLDLATNSRNVEYLRKNVWKSITD